MIDRQTVETRIAQLELQEQQALANANACMGAIAELRKLLELLDAPAAGDNGNHPPPGALKR